MKFCSLRIKEKDNYVQSMFFSQKYKFKPYKYLVFQQM